VWFLPLEIGIVRSPFGIAHFLEGNLFAVVKSVEPNKPTDAKGVYWETAHIFVDPADEYHMDDHVTVLICYFIISRRKRKK
jgi:hypothetical protein